MTENFIQLFTKLENWRFEQFNPQVDITNPIGTACVVQLKGGNRRGNFKLEQFEALLQDPQASQLQALSCRIEYDYWNCQIQFGAVLEAVCDACEYLPNLQALFIGDSEEHEYRKSKIDVFDIRPILEAYPNLQVLQVRGCFSEYELECKALRHEHLKTLIIETADLSSQNLSQICALELPALEYLELWLGRQLRNAKHTIDRLLPIFFGESFPNLSYLGLCSSEYADQIAEAVVQSPIIDRLCVLDLSMGNLSDNGAEALLNCPAVNQLHTLNIANNCVSTSMIQQLSQLDCQAIADSQEEKVYGYGASRYYALHE